MTAQTSTITTTYQAKLLSRAWRLLQISGSNLRSDPTLDDGFTLLEVLVALAVLAFSLGTLLGIFSQALDRIHQEQFKMDANALARTLLLQAEAADPAEIRDANGTSDHGLRWRIHVQEYGSEQDRANWPQRAVQISTIVSWEDHGRDRLVTLSTMRLLPKTAKNE